MAGCAQLQHIKSILSLFGVMSLLIGLALLSQGYWLKQHARDVFTPRVDRIAEQIVKLDQQQQRREIDTQLKALSQQADIVAAVLYLSQERQGPDSILGHAPRLGNVSQYLKLTKAVQFSEAVQGQLELYFIAPFSTTRLWQYGLAIWLGISILLLATWLWIRKRLLLQEQITTQHIALLNQAQHLAHVGSWEWHIASDTLTWSEEQFNVLGFQSSQDRPCWSDLIKRIVPEDRELFQTHLHTAKTESCPFEVEYRIQLPDGSMKYLHDQVKVIGKPGELARLVIGSSQDVSQYQMMMQFVRKYEALWSAALEGTGDCVWAWELSSQQLTLSKAVDRLFEGEQPEEIHTIDDWLALIHPEDHAQWNQATQLRQAGERFSLEYRLRDNAGVYQWILSRGILTDEQEPRIIGVHSNIDQRHKLEERLLLFASLFDTTGQAIVVMDVDWQIKYINPAFTQLFGYQRSDILEKNFRCLLARQQTDSYIVECESGGSWTGKLFQQKQDGSEFVSHNSFGQVRDEQGEIRFLFNILYDYTSELDHQQELYEAKEKADAASQAKSDFLSNMSHEIRTPMGAIIGLSRLCLDTRLSATQHNYVLKINRSAESLLGIINDILDFSKIEAGKLNIEKINFDLAEVLYNLRTIVLPKLEEKGLALSVEINPEVVNAPFLGDPLRIGQILINLLSNAIKFTEQGEVGLRMQLENPQTDGVTLKVTVFDSGIGMTEEQIKRLFSTFSQADSSTSRKYGGTGLGLAICKHLVEMMGGTIHVYSRYGEGSEFVFTLQLDYADCRLSELDNTLRYDLRELRVWLLTPDLSFLQQLKEYLQGFFCCVTCSQDSVEIFSEICDSQLSRYDLLIIDEELPQQEAILEQAEKLASVKTLSLVNIDYFNESVDSAVLVKPVTEEALFNAIANLFGKQEIAADITQEPLFEQEDIDKLSGAKLLLVDDNEINQLIGSELLAKAGISIVTQGNGQMCIDLLKQEEFDGVLMDMQMPVMDGITATSIIRNQLNMQQLPIIAMTANVLQKDRQRCFDAGMNDFITKPFQPRSTLKVIAKWVTPANPRPFVPSKTMVEPEELPDIPGVDVKESVQRIGGSVANYRKMLQVFLKEHQNDAEKLKQALSEHDYQISKRLAHSLKGVTASLGAKHLQQTAAQMESLLAAQEIDDAVMVLEDVTQQLSQFVTQIIQLQPNMPEKLVALSSQSLAIPQRDQVIRVLLVDDDMMIRMVQEDMLESNHIPCESAEHGKAALELLQKYGTDYWQLVLTDIEMPEMDGVELLQQVQRIDPNLPVVGVTSHADIQPYLDKGMAAVIAKPVEKDILLETIAHYARR